MFYLRFKYSNLEVHNKMRKIYSMSLALLMLMISLKVSVDFHYCSGKLAQSKIVIGFGKAGCGMEETENSCKSSSSSSLNKTPCCENHLRQIQINDFQFSKNLSQPILEGMPTSEQVNLDLYFIEFESVCIPNYKIPPDITSVSLPVIGVFLI